MQPKEATPEEYLNELPEDRKTTLNNCRKALGHCTAPSKFAGLSWQESLRLMTGIDVSRCPVCNKGRMTILSTLKGYRTPPV